MCCLPHASARACGQLRAASILDKFERSSQLSAPGREWLTAALDPFHDFEMDDCGLPDADTSKVVVQTIKESYSVVNPSPGTSGWSAHVFSMPQAKNTSLLPLSGPYIASTAINQPNITPTTGPNTNIDQEGVGSFDVWAPCRDAGGSFLPVTFGLLNVHTFPAGQSTFMPNNTQTWHRPAVSVALGESSFPQYGRRRLISFGFEVHDTTAVINKQGTLTAYTVPQTMTESDYAVPDLASAVPTAPYPFNLFGTTGSNPFETHAYGWPNTTPFMEFSLPPAGLKDALAYAGTRQWEAKDGAYVVCRQDVMRNKLVFNQSRRILYSFGDAAPINLLAGGANVVQLAPGTAYGAPTYTEPVIVDATAGNYTNRYPICTTPDQVSHQAFVVPFHTSGVFLTGLADSSTFTVTLRTTWEICPLLGDQDPSLVYLARPSPEHDPLALELYQRASIMMPVAVPVSMNAAGDFWDWTLRTLSAVAPAAGNFLGGSPGAAAGKLLAGGLDKIRGRRNAAAELQDNANRAIIDTTNFKPRVKSLPTEPGVPRQRGISGSAKKRQSGSSRVSEKSVNRSLRKLAITSGKSVKALAKLNPRSKLRAS